MDEIVETIVQFRIHIMQSAATGGELLLTLGGEHELAHLAAGADVEMSFGEQTNSRLAQLRQALIDHAPTNPIVIS